METIHSDGRSVQNFMTDLELCTCICMMFIKSDEEMEQAILEETIAI